MHSLTTHHSDNVAWYRQVAAGWARRMITGDSPGAWAQNTETEIQFALKHLALDAGDRLLDLGCGWGRHSLPLAASGVRVTGVDISRELLTLAQYNARRRQLDVDWIEADIAELPLNGTYDAVAQFCGNFLTWFPDDESTLNALWSVANVLRPGGRMLIGTSDWSLDLPQRKQDWDEWRGGAAIYRHRYDRTQRIAHSQTVVFGPEHERREYTRQRWWPSHCDMQLLFEQVGLTVDGIYNSYVESPFDPRLPGLIFVLRRED